LANVLKDLLVRIRTEVDKAPLREVNREVSALSASFVKMGAVAGAAFTAATVAGVGFAIKLGGEFEQTQVAFETMLGSTEKAKSLLEDLNNFAATTPFEIKGLRDTTKRLLAYNFAQEEIIPTLETLGNIASGVGKESLPRLTRALGQIKAKGFLKGQELLQLTETGVPVVEALAKVTGKSAKEINDNTAKLGITFRQVQQALTDISKGKFANLMEKQSATFLGIWSNIKDIMTQIFEKSGVESLKKSFKPLLAMFLKWLVANKELIKTGLVKFISGIGKAIKKLVEFTIEWQRVLKPLAALMAVVFAGTMVGSIMHVVKVFGLLKVAALKAYAAAVLPWVGLAVLVAAVGLVVEDVWLTFSDPKALTVTRLLLKEWEENFPNAFKAVKEALKGIKRTIMLIVGGLRLVAELMVGIFTGDYSGFDKQLKIVNKDLLLMQSTLEKITSMLNIKTYVGAALGGGSFETGAAFTKATQGVGAADFIKALFQQATGGNRERYDKQFTPANNTINITVDGAGTADPYAYGQSIGSGINQSLQTINGG
jgi:tape measure domain-containing protein